MISDRTRLKVLLLQGLVFTCLRGISGQSCSQTEIDQCLDGLITFQTSGENGEVLVIDTESELDTLCQRFQESDRCMSAIISSCDEIAVATWEGLRDAYQYLCTESRDAFLAQNTCVQENSAALESGSSSCASTYTGRATGVRSSSKVCSLTKDLIKCVGDLVEGYCGKAASDWQTEFLTRFYQPLFSLIDCDLRSSGLSTGAIVGIVIGSVVFLALIIGCVVFCCTRK